MKHRWLVLTTLAAALLASSVGPSVAGAQDVYVTGPLANAPAVRHMRLYRKGRIALTPAVALTLQDEYNTTMFGGLTATYHLTDWLGIGLWGAGGLVHFDTNLTQEIEAKAVTTDQNRLSLPNPRRFGTQDGQLTFAAALQAVFIPLRGKLSLFQKAFVDTDFYVFAGAAFVGIQERSNITDAECRASGTGTPAEYQMCLEGQQNDRSGRTTVAPTFGAGLNLYFNEFLGLNLEWRGLPFKWNTSGTDERGNNGFPDGQINASDRLSHFNHMVSLGLVIFLPTQIHISE